MPSGQYGRHRRGLFENASQTESLQILILAIKIELRFSLDAFSLIRCCQSSWSFGREALLKINSKKNIEFRPVKSESLTRCLLVPLYFPCCYRFYHRAVTLAADRQTPIDITKFLHLIFSLAADRH